MRGEERREEYALVLDFLRTGKAFSGKAEPIAQLLGEEWFTLLEALPKPNVEMSPRERVYIGREEREKIAMIKTRINFDQLTETAKTELPGAITAIVKAQEARFVEAFNKAGPISIREHSLSLLPGIGSKHLSAILKAREEKKFESFQDMAARVPFMPDPVKAITDRILGELHGESRFYLFTKPPQQKSEWGSR